MKQASGFYSDSLEMLLDTMCNVLGMVIFFTLTLAQLVQQAPSPASSPSPAMLADDLASVSASNKVVQAEIEQLSEQIQKSQSQTNLMSLPNEQQTDRKPWGVIVRYGRLYPLNLIAPGTASGQTKNLRSLAWRNDLVEPKWGQGDEPETGIADMAALFQQNSKTNFYFYFLVYDDSFAAFNRAKETAVGLGFQYGWYPYPEAAKLHATARGSGPMPVQN